MSVLLMEWSPLPDITDWLGWGKHLLWVAARCWLRGVVAPGTSLWHSLHAALSAEVSISKDLLGSQWPRLWVSRRLVRPVGVFGGESCWCPPDRFLPLGVSWLRWLPLGFRSGSWVPWWWKWLCVWCTGAIEWPWSRNLDMGARRALAAQGSEVWRLGSGALPTP